MKAELIAIGSELTCGAALDTNSQWLSQQLESRGYTVTRHTTVGDSLDIMVDVLQAAARRSRVVLITGGLGPTRDDITRDALAVAFDQPLVEDAGELDHIRSLFARFRRRMPERNTVQALRPRDARPLRNNHGTAPGILLERSDPDCTLAALPGVPREMKHMFHEQLVSGLPRPDTVVRRVVLRTFGYGESHVEEKLGDLTARGRNPEVGITASGAVISLSVTARADSEEQCQEMIQPVVDHIRDRLGQAVYGQDDDQLQTVVHRLLAAAGLTVAVTEGTATAGLLSRWLLAEESAAGPSVIRKAELIPPKDSPGGLLERCDTMRQHADFAIVSSHVTDSADSKDGQNRAAAVWRGQVAVTGPGLQQVIDADFAGNTGIFHERAARMALNRIRLHLLQHGSGGTSAGPLTANDG